MIYLLSIFENFSNPRNLLNYTCFALSTFHFLEIHVDVHMYILPSFPFKIMILELLDLSS